MDTRGRQTSAFSAAPGYGFHVVEGSPLPEQPVEIGDTWDEVDELPRTDRVVRRSIHYELTAIEGGGDDRIAVVTTMVHLDHGMTDAVAEPHTMRIAVRDAFLVESHHSSSQQCPTTTDTSVRAIE